RVSWVPGPLSVLIGVNGSGKSNLLRALALLSDTARGRLSSSIREAGGITPLLWDGQSPWLTWRLHVEMAREWPDRVPDRIEYNLKLERLGMGGAYLVSGEHLLQAARVVDDQRQAPFYWLDRLPERATLRTPDGDAVPYPAEALEGTESLLSLISDPVQFAPQFALRQYLSAWRVYHDIDVSFGAELRRATVTRLERQVDSDGQNLIAVLHTLYSGDKVFRDDLDAAMRAAFGPDFEELTFPPAADGRVQLRVRWRSLRRAQSAADLSDGILRFLFLITVLANPDPPPLIAIDEPEAGLHPSMLPIVAEFAADAASRTQVILTTHSPQFLSAFSDSPDSTVVVEWCDGKTELRPLSGERLDRWLEHYKLGDLWLSGELEE
ncbi:MAG: AAA family ATPase, partial [Chloroflexota bacterium]|nr:AAA family ATPase [Chloroflexota bacterium]